MSISLAPNFIWQFFDDDGAPLSGGFLYTYQAGTITPHETYTDSTGDTPNTNPVILDSGGRCNLWLDTTSYKFVVTDSNGDVIRTTDDVSQPGVGPQGASYYTGAGVPDNTLGNNGDSYLDVNTGSIYQKASNAWTLFYSPWTKFSVTDGQSATNLSGQTVDSAAYSSAHYRYEVLRGTSPSQVMDSGEFELQYLNGAWRFENGEDVGDLAGITFSLTGTTVAQLQAAASSGVGNGTIKIYRILVPV